MIAKISGSGERISTYEIADGEMAAGSTFGSPKCALIVKATGAIEKFYSIEAGLELFGTVVLHHWDERSGIPLAPLPGQFVIHPEHQEHIFELVNGVSVREDIFVLNGAPDGDRVDPPAAYYVVEMTNDSPEEVRVATYASAQLRGNTGHDVRATYSKKHKAFVIWNESDGDNVRLFGSSVEPSSFETNLNNNKANAALFPGELGNKTLSGVGDLVGILHFSTVLKPHESASFTLRLGCSSGGRRAAERAYAACPSVREARRRTREYYDDVLDRAVMITPDSDVNRGVLWAKANMLRVQSLAQTGWCFVNDPTRSNNSVGRDTAWYAFGSDYVTPEFSRASLLWYAEHLEKYGMVAEYYDIRTGMTADYKLNINDNTPLLIQALWHHFASTGDLDFLKHVYRYALKAARYILSQRNERGLVWCTATGTADWGIVGWRNVIQNYRLSGATTELNSECYAALGSMSRMARALRKHGAAAEFEREAKALRDAINAHLLDPVSGLYYLNIDLDGNPRTDVTSDLVFPVMFGVADEDTAAHIIGRLSVPEFWSDAGIHTVPRDDLNYGPTHGYGLLGGVWVGVTFWYAFAAARFNPGFMAYALSSSFRHYSNDPRRNNTVPGQFSEWLHGETLTNQGMMLSPWFPPRYVWAAVEGAAGLDLSGPQPRIHPHLAPDWKWLAIRNVCLSGTYAAWFVARVGEERTYATYRFDRSGPYEFYEEDISPSVRASGDAVSQLAFRNGVDVVVFVGNTTDRTVATSVRLRVPLEGSYSAREFNSIRGEWLESASFDLAALAVGMAVQIDSKGFYLLELRQVA